MRSSVDDMLWFDYNAKLMSSICGLRSQLDWNIEAQTNGTCDRLEFRLWSISTLLAERLARTQPIHPILRSYRCGECQTCAHFLHLLIFLSHSCRPQICRIERERKEWKWEMDGWTRSRPEKKYRLKYSRLRRNKFEYLSGLSIARVSCCAHLRRFKCFNASVSASARSPANMKTWKNINDSLT